MADTFRRMLGNNGSKMAALVDRWRSGSSKELGWLVCLLGAGFGSPSAAERITRTGRCVRGGVCSDPVPGPLCLACQRHGAPFINFKMFIPCELFNAHRKISAQWRMLIFKALQFSCRPWKCLIQVKVWAEFGWKSEEKQTPIHGTASNFVYISALGLGAK